MKTAHDCPACGCRFYTSANLDQPTTQEVLADISRQCSTMRTELLKTVVEAEGPYTQSLVTQLLGVLNQAEGLADSALLFSARERAGTF